MFQECVCGHSLANHGCYGCLRCACSRFQKSGSATPSWTILLLAAVIVALCVAAWLFAPLADGAPAPTYRGQTLRQCLSRTGWSVTWSAPTYGYGYGCYAGCYPPPPPESGTARLFPSGLWACHRGGLQYLGTWSLEGRTLAFTEECEEEPWRSGRSYVVELAEEGAGFAGGFDGGGRFVLRP